MSSSVAHRRKKLLQARSVERFHAHELMTMPAQKNDRMCTCMASRLGRWRCSQCDTVSSVSSHSLS